MDAGRELDALVAGEENAFSTDIAAAWQVVEKLCTLNADINEVLIAMEKIGNTPTWRVRVTRKRYKEKEIGARSPDTAAHAICLAALKAVVRSGELIWHFTTN